MDPASALADLMELSSPIDAAVVLDVEGVVVAATGAAGDRLARAGTELLRAADERLGSGGRAVAQLEAALREGSVFVVRGQGRTIVARTRPRPPSALVLHDLAACLDSISGPARPKRRRRTKETADA